MVLLTRLENGLHAPIQDKNILQLLGSTSERVPVDYVRKYIIISESVFTFTKDFSWKGYEITSSGVEQSTGQCVHPGELERYCDLPHKVACLVRGLIHAAVIRK